MSNHLHFGIKLMRENEYNELSEKIIGCAYAVANILGSGFLEKVYENALCIELNKAGLIAEQQVPMKVYYDCICVGDYFVDILVEHEIVIELKSVRKIEGVHLAQMLNYLKGMQKKLGLIINFSRPKVEIRRIVNNF